MHHLRHGLFHLGPPLDHGPLPALFYFALSGPDSLTLDPFNQPIQFLQNRMIRIFSMTLPGHEEGLLPTKAMSLWAEDMEKGTDILGDFLKEAESAVHYAINENLIDPNKLGVAGLSRGAFIASHLAARIKHFRFILGFAPLTKLSCIEEFSHLQENPLVNRFDLKNIAKEISDRHTRLYIGNDDTRVGTDACFEFAKEIVLHKKTRTSQVEFIMSPSIGHKGHGTSPEIFKAGANWIENHLSTH